MNNLLGSKKRITRTVSERIFWCCLIAPAFLIVALFILLPVCDSVMKSFTDYKLVNIVRNVAPEWNAFQNYINLFERGVLTQSVEVTLIFVVVVVIVAMVIGMGLALALNSGIKGARFLRSIMMAPWVVPTIISAVIWAWIYQPQYGVLKYIVRIFSGGEVDSFAMLLNSNTSALVGVMIAALWKQIPLMTLMFLAGLQNVPKDILEAADIDGATGIRKFFNIIVPYMSSVIKVTVSMSIIDNFKQFPLFWQMTKGGPNGATTTLAVLSYQEAFVDGNFGSGAAVTTIWMLVMIVVVVFYNKIFKVSEM